jgi:hypothetical protein
VLADGSLASYFRVWWNRSIWEKDSPEQWTYRRESGTQRGGGGRLAMTRILIVRRTRPPLAVRRGTQMVPDCAVMTCLGHSRRGARPSGPTSGAGLTVSRPSLDEPASHP